MPENMWDKARVESDVAALQHLMYKQYFPERDVLSQQYGIKSNLPLL